MIINNNESPLKCQEYVEIRDNTKFYRMYTAS